MNRDEAKQTLLLYRPGTADAEDPQVVEAMAVARQDPELGRWFMRHVAFQKAMRQKLRQIEVPMHLKAGLLVRRQTAAWWPRPSRLWMSAGVVLALLGGLAALWLRPADTHRFALFQERMVGQAIREYVMEWETSDMSRLRRSIAARGGPSDYDVPKGLERLKLSGGGVLRWQGKPVSMACFDRGGGRMLFLFVMRRSALKDPPPSQTPRLALVHECSAAAWTRGDNIYVLAGADEKDLAAFAKKYL